MQKSRWTTGQKAASVSAPSSELIKIVRFLAVIAPTWVGEARILAVPSECARPRAQQFPTRPPCWNVPSLRCLRTSLRPRTGALRPPCLRWLYPGDPPAREARRSAVGWVPGTSADPTARPPEGPDRRPTPPG